MKFGFEGPTRYLDRFSFAHKLDLVHGLGFMTERDLAACKHLNRMRNRLAHELGGDPEPSDVEELIDRMSETPRSAFHALVHYDDLSHDDECRAWDMSDWTDGLRASFLCYLLHLSRVLAMEEWHRDYERQHMAYAVLVNVLPVAGRGVNEDELRRRVGLLSPPVPGEGFR